MAVLPTVAPQIQSPPTIQPMSASQAQQPAALSTTATATTSSVDAFHANSPAATPDTTSITGALPAIRNTRSAHAAHQAELAGPTTPLPPRLSKSGGGDIHTTLPRTPRSRPPLGERRAEKDSNRGGVRLSSLLNTSRTNVWTAEASGRSLPLRSPLLAHASHANLGGISQPDLADIGRHPSSSQQPAAHEVIASAYDSATSATIQALQRANQDLRMQTHELQNQVAQLQAEKQRRAADHAEEIQMLRNKLTANALSSDSSRQIIAASSAQASLSHEQQHIQNETAQRQLDELQQLTEAFQRAEVQWESSKVMLVAEKDDRIALLERELRIAKEELEEQRYQLGRSEEAAEDTARELRRERDAAMERVNLLHQRVQRQAKEMNESAAQLRQLRSERDSASRAAAAVRQQAEAGTGPSVEDIQEGLADRVRGMGREALEATCLQLQRQLRESHERTDYLSAQLASDQSLHESMHDDLIATKRRVAQLEAARRSENAAAQKKHEERVADLMAQLASMQADAAQTLKSVQIDFRKAKEGLVDQQQATAAAESELEQLRRSEQDLRQRLAAQERSNRELSDDVRKLQDQVARDAESTAVTDILKSTQQAEVRRLQNEMGFLREQLRDERDANASLTQTLSGLQLQVYAMRDLKEELTTRHEQAMAQLETITDRKLQLSAEREAVLQVELASSMKDSAALRKHRAELQQRLERLEAEHAEAEAEWSAKSLVLEQRLSQQKQNQSQGEAKQESAVVAQLQRALESMQADQAEAAEELRKHIQGLHQQLSQAQRRTLLVDQQATTAQTKERRLRAAGMVGALLHRWVHRQSQRALHQLQANSAVQRAVVQLTQEHREVVQAMEQDARNDLQETCEALIVDHGNQLDELKANLQGQAREHADMVNEDGLAAQHRLRERLDDKWTRIMAAQRKELLDEAQKSKEAALIELEETAAEHAGRLEDELGAAVLQAQNLRQQLDIAQAEHKTVLQELSSQYERELLQRERDAKIMEQELRQQLSEQHGRAVEALQVATITEQRDAALTKVEQLQQELDAGAQRHQEALMKASEQYEAAKTALVDQMEGRNRAATDRLMQQMAQQSRQMASDRYV